METVRHWLQPFRGQGWLTGAALAATIALVSMAAGVAMVVFLPADYFVRTPVRSRFWQSHAALRAIFLVTKNLLGAAAFVAGFVMALPLVPGPGILFMLVGLAALDFPGKRALERRLLASPRILGSANRLRARFGKPPIQTGTAPSSR